jgi:hypothetical protein
LIDGIPSRAAQHVVVCFRDARWLFLPGSDGPDVFLLELDPKTSDADAVARAFRESECI